MKHKRFSMQSSLSRIFLCVSLILCLSVTPVNTGVTDSLGNVALQQLIGQYEDESSDSTLFSLLRSIWSDISGKITTLQGTANDNNAKLVAVDSKLDTVSTKVDVSVSGSI